MRRFRRIMCSRVSTAAAAAILPLAVLAATNAMAADDATINACVQKDSRAVRIVDSPADCRATEAAVSWSQQGRPGPQGPQGPQGATGPVGPQGPAGIPCPSTSGGGGCVRTSDLAGDDVGGVIGAVTSEKIADGTITSRDLATGSVTTDKQLANAASGSGAGASPGVFASTTLIVPSGNHRVLLTGQAQLSCQTCATLPVQVTYKVVEGITQITDPYTVTIDHPDQKVVLPVSLVITASAGSHTYSLNVSAPTTGGTVTVAPALLAAVDLGSAL